MKKFMITNTFSGFCLGIYEAETEKDALDSMARNAGYDNYDHANSVSQAKVGEIKVEEVEEPEPLKYIFYGLDRNKIPGKHPGEFMNEQVECKTHEEAEELAEGYALMWAMDVMYHESGSTEKYYFYV